MEKHGLRIEDVLELTETFWGRGYKIYKFKDSSGHEIRWSTASKRMLPKKMKSRARFTVISSGYKWKAVKNVRFVE